MRERTSRHTRAPEARRILAAALLVLLTLLTFARTAQNGFVYDDDLYVSRNLVVQGGLSPQGLRWALADTATGNWHPLTMLSHMLDVRLFGMDPAGHHLVNLLFHTANALLLFFILEGMSSCLWRSALAAGLFAIHPLHVESVAMVAQRKDVLSTFLWLLTTWLYLAYVRKPRGGTYALAVVSFALGLSAKPMLMTLPLVLLLLDWWPLGRCTPGGGDPRRAWMGGLLLEKLPFLALAGAAGVVALMTQSKRGSVMLLKEFSLPVRAANALHSAVAYLEKAVWPVHLAAFYPHPGTGLTVQRWVLAAVVLACLTAAAIRYARRFPYFLTGWLWYLVTLIPVIGLVQVGLQGMADRYTYVPLVGVFIAAAWGVGGLVERWGRLKPAVLAAVGLAGAALMTLSVVQVGYWRDNITLWQHTGEVTEANAFAWYNLGAAFGKQERLQEALHAYDQAIRHEPLFTRAHNNKGVVLAYLGKGEAAIAEYRAALRLDPESAATWYNLGVEQSQRGSYAEAIDSYRRALGIAPGYVDPRFQLALLLASMGRTGEALAQLRQTLKVDPGHQAARRKLVELGGP